ncbi:PREDICTED: uncharacterized protein LOC104600324 [Nelumbo nucifera]|uniref:Uncharacterized protein LOC104600324 n=1 Tax=Nelumbo nucifera TaxID=4432 RepID=A0A1U8AHH2_NELNU|nr:PREDICTED: uncharacterized protein LOC104600324 [Nelumbo nucifera]
MEKAAQEQKRPIWDCGSSLYDSFELNAFKRHLDSAIASRTMSMPRLSDPVRPPQAQPVPKKSSKISRSLNRFLRSVFRSKPNPGTMYGAAERPQHESPYTFYDPSHTLSTIPEVADVGMNYNNMMIRVSPEFNSLSLPRRTTSERFTATRIGISCA